MKAEDIKMLSLTLFALLAGTGLLFDSNLLIRGGGFFGIVFGVLFIADYLE